jgi:hypothetical protein
MALKRKNATALREGDDWRQARCIVEADLAWGHVSELLFFLLGVAQAYVEVPYAL